MDGVILQIHPCQRHSHLTDEQFGLFEGGEVATLFELAPVGDIGVAGGSPATRDLENLVGEDAASRRDGDCTRAEAAEAVPVKAR